jgi:hypothetical protein
MFNSLGPVSIAALIILQVVVSGSAQGDSRLVGTIKDDSIRDGCGCYFQSLAEVKAHGRGVVFFSDVSGEAAWVNIDGLDVRLKRVESKSASAAGGGLPRKGDRSIDFYKGGGVKVRVDSVVTKTCPADEENCEYVWTKATITVEKGGRRQVIRGVGGCGC